MQRGSKAACCNRATRKRWKNNPFSNCLQIRVIRWAVLQRKTATNYRVELQRRKDENAMKKVIRVATLSVMNLVLVIALANKQSGND
jgi:hypothetical protein